MAARFSVGRGGCGEGESRMLVESGTRPTESRMTWGGVSPGTPCLRMGPRAVAASRLRWVESAG